MSGKTCMNCAFRAFHYFEDGYCRMYNAAFAKDGYCKYWKRHMRYRYLTPYRTWIDGIYYAELVPYDWVTAWESRLSFPLPKEYKKANKELFIKIIDAINWGELILDEYHLRGDALYIEKFSYRLPDREAIK